MVTFLEGPELYRRELELKKLLPEGAERFTKFDSACMTALAEGNTLFGKRTVYVEQETLENSKELLKYLDAPDGADLVVAVSSAGRARKLAEKLRKAGKCISCGKLTEKELSDYILKGLKSCERSKSQLFGRPCQIRISTEAMKSFIERSGYLENEESTLYGVNISVKQLMFLDSDDIGVEEIACIFPEMEDEDARQLQKALFGKKAGRVMGIAAQIAGKSVETIGVLGLLLRTFRIVWKVKRLELPEGKAPAALGLNQWSWGYVAPAVAFSLEAVEKSMKALEEAAIDIKSGKVPSREGFLFAIGKVVEACR